MKCKKCSHALPCPKHTIMIDEKTGNILFPDKNIDEKQKQRIKDLRDVLKDL